MLCVAARDDHAAGRRVGRRGVSGTLDAHSSAGAGCAVAVSGAHVVVAHRGRIMATGAIRGGTIAVRGGALGGFVETSGASPRYLDVTGASVRTARS